MKKFIPLVILVAILTIFSGSAIAQTKGKIECKALTTDLQDSRQTTLNCNEDLQSRHNSSVVSAIQNIKGVRGVSLQGDRRIIITHPKKKWGDIRKSVAAEIENSCGYREAEFKEDKGGLVTRGFKGLGGAIF